MVKEYYRRWVREHPRLQVYVSREEYNRIRELAENMGLSVSELVRRGLLDLRKLQEEVYDRAWDQGFDVAVWMIARGDDNPLIADVLKKYNLEYSRCPICGKPFAGFLVRKDSELAERIRRLIKEERLRT